MITTTTTQVPVNAVNEAQAVDMLTGMGVYLDNVHAAFYRLRTRTNTLLVQGSLSLRCERLAEDVFVVRLVTR